MRKIIQALILAVFLFAWFGCSSSMSSFQNPEVKGGGEIKGAIIGGNTNSMEIQTVLGIGYNIDIGVKFNPFFPVFIWERELRFPLEADIKYQILLEPLYLTTGLGWSNVVNRDRVSDRFLEKAESKRLYLLFGTSHIYGGVNVNYLIGGKSFTAGAINPIVLQTNKLFFSYTAGLSIGRSFRFNPEVTLLPSNNKLYSVWGVSLEFTGAFKL